jgi:hypothetical protein
MSGVNPFEAHHPRDEAWFDTNAAAYISALLALRPFVPWEGRGIEIGVGSGRFAAPPLFIPRPRWGTLCGKQVFQFTPGARRWRIRCARHDRSNP